MIIFYKDDFIKDVVAGHANLHFRYGAGVFETLLYDGRKVLNLEQHLNRLVNSTKEFGYAAYSFDYSGVIAKLLEENWLQELPAKINICHLMENFEEYYVFVAAAPFTPPPLDKVFRLCIYPHIHDTYMSRHKTMNYMHFLMAKRFAELKGCDDALLLGSDGCVLETSTAALVFCDGSDYFVPESENRLPSIALENFSKSHQLTVKNIKADEIADYEILMMNSLMGARKAELI